jgi:hypothetical protein
MSSLRPELDLSSTVKTPSLVAVDDRVRPGGVIGIGGPDGSGKSTLIEGLRADALAGARYRHMRSPGILFRRNPGGGAPVTEPHADPPYGMVMSLAKTGYLFVDYLLSWFLQIRPHVRRGGWLVLERGWWDMAVDPLRYRMTPVAGRLIRILGRLLPPLDVLLVLEAPGAEIHRRKEELEPKEIDRQVRAWHEVLPARQRRVFLDATAAPGAVVARAAVELGIPVSSNPAGWANLPTRGRSRWIVPRGPRSSARSALSIYHPMTTKGFVAWNGARLVAGLGGFRLLPRGEEPNGVASALDRWTPPGGTIALAKTNHPHRYVALLLDSDGHPWRVAKLATERDPTNALQREAAAIARFAPLLPPPLGAPELLESDDRCLIQAPVEWVARRDPWRLPPEVARALGAFHAKDRSGQRGLAHGDCAPWNLLRTPTGWTLIDWEYASDRDLAFSDVFNYVVQAHALLGRPSERDVIRGVRGHGWIGDALSSYAGAAEIPIAAIPNLFVRWLKESSSKQDPTTSDGRLCIQARTRLLAGMGA